MNEAEMDMAYNYVLILLPEKRHHWLQSKQLWEIGVDINKIQKRHKGNKGIIGKGRLICKTITPSLSLYIY